MNRFICHLLIVWLTLLAGGAHAHAAADAAQELDHIAAHAIEAQLAGTQDAEKSAITHDHGHSETCGLSHCGHGHSTGMLATANLCFSDAGVGAAFPTPQAWACREQPNSIERPKWAFTTLAVVNL
ncbi:hypothetical protein [Polaromonas eurypsychrophila]|uniref:Cobalt transporter n=1 Tax=Polaromonas eurypsychrophila TaxID=1614635 RepID=A0A916SHG0_9BURK|nr:hypothetical protein [Polaromonas eurypsychrophila]GGA96397.1 hypothetical protein GCM10011496_16820 [Polaromonas eurypsychrophila]